MLLKVSVAITHRQSGFIMALHFYRSSILTNFCRISPDFTLFWQYLVPLAYRYSQSEGQKVRIGPT